MIIFVGEGGLGNQLFQYAFLSTIKKHGELLYTYGFDALRKYCTVSDVVHISSQHRVNRVLIKYFVHPALRILGHLRVITTITQQVEQVGGIAREKETYNIAPGIYSRILYVKPGFFQSEKLFLAKKIHHLRLKKESYLAADKYLSSLPKSKHRVFIHFRYGDYLHFRLGGKNVILPASYYLQCIATLDKTLRDPQYLLISDDPARIPKKIVTLHNTVLAAKMDEGTTLAIMSRCDGAILSPSSFGWWGSYLMASHRQVYVPRHWLGFNLQLDYPAGSLPNYAHQIRVK